MGFGGDAAGLTRAGEVFHIVAPNASRYGAKTSAIRQSGLEYGYAEGYDYVLTVDDDCILPADWAANHRSTLGGLVPVVVNTVPGHVIRGRTVDHMLPIGISHGLWSGVLDYPAWWQLSNNPPNIKIEDRGWEKISSPFPMCGMNVGFRREVLPAVFFQHTFLRHDDIFAGWLAQQVLDLHGYGFANGGAVVQHLRASNAEENLKKEAPGDAVNKALLSHIRNFRTIHDGEPVGETFARLVEHVARLRVGDQELDRKIVNMAAAMRGWSKRSKR
jgi:hypothetical protein